MVSEIAEQVCSLHDGGVNLLCLGTQSSKDPTHLWRLLGVVVAAMDAQGVDTPIMHSARWACSRPTQDGTKEQRLKDMLMHSAPNLSAPLPLFLLVKHERAKK